MKKLIGKCALITGSSRGIGQQVALALAEQGCDVIVHGRTLDNIQSTVDLLKIKGVNVYSVFGELDSSNSVQQVIEMVQALPANVDLLFNNAAINNTSTPVFEFSMAEWMRTFQINLFSLVQLCSAFGPGMKQRNWGRIINTTSGIADQPNLAPYSASKAALDKYTKDLAVEFKGCNVLVNCVDPGWIKTDLGGPDAWEEVESVIPGMLVPALLEDNGPTGQYYSAQDFKGLWS
jgi:NAD(P)-dependent dehydrogenase (short-subunit alcohol dehydrogenase family)